MGTILKSRDGMPTPQFPVPRGVSLAAEARTARRRFYPVTIAYTVYAASVCSLALQGGPLRALAYLAAGVALWTWVEYLVHRFILHGRFADGPGFWKHRLHSFFDPMHGDHHKRPWDGMYINGYLDTLPFAVVLALLSFLAPIDTAPTALAAILLCYVIEEWVHYSVHFHRFRWRYFDYIRRHHMYHHSARGGDIAFGLTSGLWDVLSGTRIPASDRAVLYGRGRRNEFLDRPEAGVQQVNTR